MLLIFISLQVSEVYWFPSFQNVRGFCVQVQIHRWLSKKVNFCLYSNHRKYRFLPNNSITTFSREKKTFLSWTLREKTFFLYNLVIWLRVCGQKMKQHFSLKWTNDFKQFILSCVQIKYSNLWVTTIACDAISTPAQSSIFDQSPASIRRVPSPLDISVSSNSGW